MTFALQAEFQHRTGIGHYPTLGIKDTDGDYTHVAPIGCNLLTVGHELHAGSLTGGMERLGKDFLSVLIAYGLQASGLIDSLPLQMTVTGHGLAAQGTAIDREFHFVAVAIGPYFNGLALMSLQIPVGEDVEHGLFGPPRLEIPGFVFGETAIVEDAEL